MRSAILTLLLLSFILVAAVVADDPSEWYTKAQSSMAAGDYATALTYYNNAIGTDKNYYQALGGKAMALNYLGRYDEALQTAESALALKSMDSTALNARALALFGEQRYSEAADAYSTLFLVEQNRKEAYCNQGYAYLVLNESAAAITAYDQCTALDPLNFENWDNKGLALMQAKKYDAALDAYDHATYITTKNATVWNNKGVALVALGKPADALECFKKALGIDPNYREAQINEDNATGKQQSFTIYGTITPVPTISRIGTLFTIVTPTAPPTEVITRTPEEQATTPAALTSATIPKKTTYSPLSPFTGIGALAVFAALTMAMRRA